MYQFYLYLSIVFNILTNVGFNLSAINEKMPAKRWAYFAGGLVFGLLNSYYFTESLKGISLQVASTAFFSLTIVGLFLVSYFGFKEQVTVLRVAGVFVIVAGVVMVSLK